MGELNVVGLFIGRHPPPHGRATGEPDRGAIKLIQQQIMLSGAAIIGAQSRITLALGKALRVDQKEMRISAQTLRPAFQQLAFFAQLFERSVTQLRAVADPYVHIALIGLGQGA